MKITLFKMTLVLLLAIGGFTVAAQAQKSDRPKPTPEARVEKMTAELNLSADQKAKFLQLEKDFQAKMPKMQKDATAEQRTQYMEARKAHRAAQRALLTKEQAVKFDEMKTRRHGKGMKGNGLCKDKVKKA